MSVNEVLRSFGIAEGGGLGRALISAGCRYGSAYSGVDAFATALEAEFGSNWTYEFASEGEVARRGAQEGAAPRLGGARAPGGHLPRGRAVGGRH